MNRRSGEPDDVGKSMSTTLNFYAELTTLVFLASIILIKAEWMRMLANLIKTSDSFAGSESFSRRWKV